MDKGTELQDYGQRHIVTGHRYTGIWTKTQSYRIMDQDIDLELHDNRPRLIVYGVCFMCKSFMTLSKIELPSEGEDLIPLSFCLPHTIYSSYTDMVVTKVLSLRIPKAIQECNPDERKEFQKH